MRGDGAGDHRAPRIPLGTCRERGGLAHLRASTAAGKYTARPFPRGDTVSDALVIRIHPKDDVVIARQQLVGGTRIESEDITVAGLIPPGHKIATRAIAAGEPVRRYDQIIGSAKQAIAPGQHVHTHNLEFSTFARDYAATSGAQPTDYAAERATFDGIVRADGRVATRNYIGILTSVNCSATVARAIADHFRRDTNPARARALPERRRRDRADARRRLRHRQRRRAAAGAAPHPRRLRAPRRTSPR